MPSPAPREALYLDPKGSPVKQPFHPYIIAADNSPATAVKFLTDRGGTQHVSEKTYDATAAAYAKLPILAKDIFADQCDSWQASRSTSGAEGKFDKLSPQQREEYLKTIKAVGLSVSDQNAAIVSDVRTGKAKRNTAVYSVGQQPMLAAHMDDPLSVSYNMGNAAFAQGNLYVAKELLSLAREGKIAEMEKLIKSNAIVNGRSSDDVDMELASPAVAHQSALNLLAVYNPQAYHAAVAADQLARLNRPVSPATMKIVAAATGSGLGGPSEPSSQSPVSRGAQRPVQNALHM